jgi:glycolate oxidase FAD binding subunit
MILHPPDEPALCDAVRAETRVLPFAGRTKPALSPSEGVTLLDLRAFSGIVEYEPTEYTFTARAATPLRDVASLLAANGQYLPFDPPLASAGATLAGSVAAAMSGPGRLRYGGIRDFLIGIRWVDGSGQIVRGGGKVVKNAAGFDFPKLFTGALGRLGILTELSFKVFPAHEARQSIAITCSSLPDALEKIAPLSAQTWEVEAAEIFPGPPIRILARFMGDAPALASRINRIAASFGPAAQLLSDHEAASFWNPLNDLILPETNALSPLVKVPTTLHRLPALDAALVSIGAIRHYSMAGNLALISSPDAPALDAILSNLALSGLRLRGPGPVRPGIPNASLMESRVSSALDPLRKFLPLSTP